MGFPPGLSEKHRCLGFDSVPFPPGRGYCLRPEGLRIHNEGPIRVKAGGRGRQQDGRLDRWATGQLDIGCALPQSKPPNKSQSKIIMGINRWMGLAFGRPQIIVSPSSATMCVVFCGDGFSRVDRESGEAQGWRSEIPLAIPLQTVATKYASWQSRFFFKLLSHYYYLY